MIESVYNEIVLNEVAKATILAGRPVLAEHRRWMVMSGRVLRPVKEITDGPGDPGFRSEPPHQLSKAPMTITRLAATFDGMLERLDRAFSSQRRFLADTSHDLRTPRRDPVQCRRCRR